MSDSVNRLNQLFADHWEAWMKWDPIFATQCGDHRYDNLLPQAGEDHFSSRREQLISFRERQRLINRDELSGLDKLNYDIFAQQLDLEISELSYYAYRLPLSKAGDSRFPSLTYAFTPHLRP